jgi:hypothetical protein
VPFNSLTSPSRSSADPCQWARSRALHVERTRLTADWVVDELRKLAGANMDDCMKANPSGDPYLDLSALTRDQTATLQLKRAALVDLGRHLGLFEIKHRIAGELEVKTSSLSDWSLADRGMERRFALREPATGC